MRLPSLLATILLPGLCFLTACGDDGGTGAGGAGASGGGGAGGGAAIPRYVSGTRLKIRVQKAGDAEQYWEMYDSELGAACGPGLGTDGALRCMPSGYVGQVLYTDASCTQPVLQRSDIVCELDPAYGKYVTEARYDAGCGVSSVMLRAFQVGADLTSPPATVYADDGVTCVAIPGLAGEFAELAEVAPEAFAAFETVTEPRGDDLSVIYLQSADGARLIGDSPTDVARGLPCGPSPAGDGFVCLPGVTTGAKPAYSDETCSTEVAAGALAYDPACAKPTLATAPSSDVCSAERYLYQVGADTAESFTLYGENCGSLGAPGYAYAELGAEIPLSELPALEEVVEGTGPARVRTYRVDGAPATRAGIWISESGERCYPYLFPDGTTRCGPPTIAYAPANGGFFADAACTQRLVQTYEQPCDPGPPAYATVASAEACGGISPHFLGALHTGQLYYGDQVSGCSSSGSDPAATYYLVGDPAPVETFAAVEIVTLEP